MPFDRHEAIITHVSPLASNFLTQHHFSYEAIADRLSTLHQLQVQGVLEAWSSQLAGRDAWNMSL